MSTEEFIAWFEGYTRRFLWGPSQKEWQEILAMVERLDAGSPLKAWFQGLRVEVHGKPSGRVWNEIRKQIGEVSTQARNRKGRLKGLFDSFEKNASALTGGADAKARKK